MAADAKLGKILVDANGRTLYLFEKDTEDRSSCYGACAGVWPPLTTAAKPTAGSGVTGSLLAITTRRDGKRQVTFHGHPLYHYVSDTGPGQTGGQGLHQFGALWYALSSQGQAITSAGATSSSSSSGSGGGNGY